MEHLTILCLLALLQSSVSTRCLIKANKGYLMDLSEFHVSGANLVVTDVNQCKAHCLDFEGGCLGANMVRIRPGAYSCQLFDDLVFSSSVNLLPTKDAFVIVKQDICYHGGSFSFLSVFPYYKCHCHVVCYGQRCQHCYPIPALFAPVVNVNITENLTLRAPGEDNWIVLLRRKDGSVDFPNKVWDEYKRGFGDLHGEFWLGNDWIHLLTTNGSYSVRFDIVAVDGRWAYAEYSKFWITPESDNYKLYFSGYSGNATDGLKANGEIFDIYAMPFSTIDRDNDQISHESCCCGGWWFNGCGYVRLTGYYMSDSQYDGIIWLYFSNKLVYADMKIKEN